MNLSLSGSLVDYLPTSLPTYLPTYLPMLFFSLHLAGDCKRMYGNIIKTCLTVVSRSGN